MSVEPSLPASPVSEPRPFTWSVRRELWEHRWITLAPFVVALVVLFASLVATSRLPEKMRSLSTLDPARQHAVIMKPFNLAPAPIMLAALLLGAFYSLEALHGERRDRSILFWKSLPVSDLTTVLSKASIPIVVLPLIAFVLSLATVYNLLILSSGVLVVNGVSPARLWAEYGLVGEPAIMLYGLAAHALWLAPIYAWLLLVSAWARRATFAWAVLPPLAASALERLALGTTHVGSFFKYRLAGAMERAFAEGVGGNVGGLEELTPARFLSTPGLWLGLAFTVVCLALAVRLRRDREPA